MVMILLIIFMTVIVAKFTVIDEQKDTHCTFANGKRVIHADSAFERLFYRIGYAYHDFIMDNISKDTVKMMKSKMKEYDKDESVLHHDDVSSGFTDYSDPKNNPFEQ